MRYREFKDISILAELKVTTNDVIRDLEKLGFNDVKKVSGKRVAVFVPNQNRIKSQKRMLTALKGSKLDKTDASSIGAVIHPNGTKINIRPSEKECVNAA